MTGAPAPKNPIRRTMIGVAIIGALFGIGSIYLKDARITASVFIGAGGAVLNLWVLAKIIKSMMPEDEQGAGEPHDEGKAEGEGKGAGGGWGLLAVIKILALFGGAFILWKSGVALPLPTLLGYGALPLGIVFTSVMTPRR